MCLIKASSDEDFQSVVEQEVASEGPQEDTRSTAAVAVNSEAEPIETTGNENFVTLVPPQRDPLAGAVVPVPPHQVRFEQFWFEAIPHLQRLPTQPTTAMCLHPISWCLWVAAVVEAVDVAAEAVPK